MKANWAECPRGDIKAQWSSVYVTMNAKGHIVLGKAAVRKLDEPPACLLLFDAANNRIGLKPTGKGIKNAFPVAKSGRHGGRVIRAFRLMKEFGIQVTDTLEFPDAEIDDDGILILNLRTAKISARAGRGWRGGRRAREANAAPPEALAKNN